MHIIMHLSCTCTNYAYVRIPVVYMDDYAFIALYDMKGLKTFQEEHWPTKINVIEVCLATDLNKRLLTFSKGIVSSLL